MNIILPLVTGGLITFLVTPLIILLAKIFKLEDDPHKRFHPAHTHIGSIPRAGGLALYLGLIVGISLLLPWQKYLLGIVCGATILVIIGLWDDYRDVNPYLRVITNAVAVLFAVGAGIGISFVTNPFTGGIIHLDTWRISFELFGPHSIVVWADIFAFIWIMWTMNIVGWSAGVDGQMPGFAAICAIIIGLLSYRFSLIDPSQSQITSLAFLVAGVFLGFLPWNFFPQKIMPGFGGKTLTGFLLAILAILSSGKVGTALLVLGMPTMDALYTLIRRIGQGHSPVWADRGHLHHRLLDLGWGKRRIALFYWIVSAILGLLALTINSREKIFTLAFLAVGIGGFLVWVNYFSQLSKPQDPDNG